MHAVFKVSYIFIAVGVIINTGSGTFTLHIRTFIAVNGDWKDNQRDGRGTYKWNVGDSYEGEWKNNQFNGQGTLIMTDVGVIINTGSGTFTLHIRTFIAVTGVEEVNTFAMSVYDGDWKDNQRDGRGTYKWNVGDSYEGEWKNNQFNLLLSRFYPFQQKDRAFCLA